jgi:hypothetical protein
MTRPSILFVLLLLARTAAAQTAPPALPAMDSEVRTGETLLVLTTAGVQVSGRLRSLTPDALALETRHGVETLPANRIGRIIKKDSIRNGLWIGLASGAAAGLTGACC